MTSSPVVSQARDTRNRELARAARKGDTEARRLLIEENRWLAKRYAGRVAQRSNRQFDDIHSDAILGLISAADRYDPATYAFATYAQFWMRQAVQRSGQLDRLIHIPTHHFKRPTAPEAAPRGKGKFAENSIRIREDLRRAMSLVYSITLGSDRRSVTRADFAVDESLIKGRCSDPVEAAARRESLDSILGHLASLDDREQLVIHRYFGLDGQSPRTLCAIGKQLGVSRERIRQIKDEAIAKIRAAVEVESSAFEAAKPKAG